MQNITVLVDNDSENILGVLVVNGHSQKEVQEQFYTYKNHRLDSWTVEGFVDYLENKKQWPVGWYNEINIMQV